MSPPERSIWSVECVFFQSRSLMTFFPVKSNDYLQSHNSSISMTTDGLEDIIFITVSFEPKFVQNRCGIQKQRIKIPQAKKHLKLEKGH